MNGFPLMQIFFKFFDNSLFFYLISDEKIAYCSMNLLWDRFRDSRGKDLRFSMEEMALCDKSIYFICWKYAIYSSLSALTCVIPFPKRLSLAFLSFCDCLVEGLMFEDSRVDSATFVNYSVVLDFIFLIYFVTVKLNCL